MTLQLNLRGYQSCIMLLGIILELARPEIAVQDGEARTGFAKRCNQNWLRKTVQPELASQNHAARIGFAKQHNNVIFSKTTFLVKKLSKARLII